MLKYSVSTLFDNQLFMSWKKVRLPDVMFFQEGPGVRNTQFRASGIKLLNVGNINDSRINLNATKIYISEEEAYGKYKHFLVDEGDLVIASSGIVVDNFHNKIAFVEKDHLPLCMNTSTVRFKCLDKNETNINFFAYYLQTKHFKDQLRKLVTGSAQLNFGPSHLKQISFEIPPLPTQKHIASILDKADALRQQNRQLLAHYDALLQSTFIELFGDPVENPKGWEVKTVIDSCEKCIVPGRDKPKSFTGNIPWITTDDLIHLWKTEESKKGMGLNLSEVNEVKARLIPKDSVIMTCVGDLGVISIAGKELLMNQQLHAFICGDKIINHFLAYVLSLRTDFMYKMASTTTVPYMNKTVCNSIPVIFPPLSLQQHFAKIVEEIESQKQQAQAALTESEALFQGLLASYFGEN